MQSRVKWVLRISDSVQAPADDIDVENPSRIDWAKCWIISRRDSASFSLYMFFHYLCLIARKISFFQLLSWLPFHFPELLQDLICGRWGLTPIAFLLTMHTKMPHVWCLSRVTKVYVSALFKWVVWAPTLTFHILTNKTWNLIFIRKVHLTAVPSTCY